MAVKVKHTFPIGNTIFMVFFAEMGNGGKTGWAITQNRNFGIQIKMGAKYIWGS